MWQQLVGGNVMMYYVVYVFSMAGLVSIPTLRSELVVSTLSMPIWSEGDADLLEIDWKHQPLLVRDPIRHLPGDHRLRSAFYRSYRTSNAALDRCRV
jgi:hypothetical protein